MIVRDENASLAATDFLRWADENRITVLDLPTAYWHELVRELSESDLNLPKSLRSVIVGGEKASASALAAWRRIAAINCARPRISAVVVTRVAAFM